MIATVVIIYSPLNKIFETVPLGVEGFIIPAAVSLLLVVIFDVWKYVNGRWGWWEVEKG